MRSFLKLSDGSGYWQTLRRSDETTYKKAVKLKRIRKKLVRCELAIRFLTKCRDTNLFPKFTRWKNANGMDPRSRNRYRRKVILDEIKSKHQEVRQIRDAVKLAETALFKDMTFIKLTYSCIFCLYQLRQRFLLMKIGKLL